MLQRMKRILVALDGSERQALVLQTALNLAETHKAELVVFRSVAVPVDLPQMALAAAPDAVGKILVDGARGNLEAALANAPAGRIREVRVEVGTPWYAIVETAKSIDADLIVIGSHGYGMLDRLIGTTAAKVVNHADRSVLVVRNPVT